MQCGCKAAPNLLKNVTSQTRGSMSKNSSFSAENSEAMRSFFFVGRLKHSLYRAGDEARNLTYPKWQLLSSDSTGKT